MQPPCRRGQGRKAWHGGRKSMPLPRPLPRIWAQSDRTHASKQQRREATESHWARPHSQRRSCRSRGLGQPPAKNPPGAWRGEAARRHLPESILPESILPEAARAGLPGGKGAGMAGFKAAAVKGMPARLILPCSATRSKMPMFRHQDETQPETSARTRSRSEPMPSCTGSSRSSAKRCPDGST